MPLAEFDGSIVVERTAGEVSARCHDKKASFLALGLMNNIATGATNAREARKYYANELPISAAEPNSIHWKAFGSPGRWQYQGLGQPGAVTTGPGGGNEKSSGAN